MHVQPVYHQDLKALCENIRITSTRGTMVAPDDYRAMAGSIHYHCILEYKGRSFSVEYWQPRSLRKHPDPYGVMYRVLNDALVIETSYSLWADDLGYDYDDKGYQELYESFREQTRRLKKFLGDDFSAFLYADVG